MKKHITFIIMLFIVFSLSKITIGAVNPVFNGLTTYFTFDDNSTGWTDNITVRKIYSSGTTQFMAPGIKNNALNCTGGVFYNITNSTNQLDYPGLPNITLPFSGTINFWYNTTSYTSDAYIISKYFNPNYEFEINSQTTGASSTIRFITNGPLEQNIITANAYQTNKYIMVTMSWNSTNVSYYMNGTLQRISAATMLTNTRAPFMFCRNQASTYFTGAIDEFGIWNRSLNSTEIALLYNSGNGTFYETVADTIAPNTSTMVSLIGYNTTNLSLGPQLDGYCSGYSNNNSAMLWYNYTWFINQTSVYSNVNTSGFPFGVNRFTNFATYNTTVWDIVSDSITSFSFNNASGADTNLKLGGNTSYDTNPQYIFMNVSKVYNLTSDYNISVSIRMIEGNNLEFGFKARDTDTPNNYARKYLLFEDGTLSYQNATHQSVKDSYTAGTTMNISFLMYANCTNLMTLNGVNYFLDKDCSWRQKVGGAFIGFYIPGNSFYSGSFYAGNFNFSLMNGLSYDKVSSYYPTTSGNYTFSCMAYDGASLTNGTWINSSLLTLTYSNTSIYSLSSNETSIKPKPGEDFLASYSVIGGDKIASCSIYNNDTMQWVLNKTTSIQSNGATVNEIWKVANLITYPNIVAVGYWYVNCTDEWNNNKISTIQSYTVKNYTAPTITQVTSNLTKLYISESPEFVTSCLASSTNSTARFTYNMKIYRDDVLLNQISDSNILQGVNFTATQPVTIAGRYKGECIVTDELTSLVATIVNTTELVVTNGPTIINNIQINQTNIYPLVNQPVKIIFNATDTDTLANCSIWNNDTGIWTSNTTFFYGNGSNNGWINTAVTPSNMQRFYDKDYDTYTLLTATDYRAYYNFSMPYDNMSQVNFSVQLGTGTSAPTTITIGCIDNDNINKNFLTINPSVEMGTNAKKNYTFTFTRGDAFVDSCFNRKNGFVFSFFYASGSGALRLTEINQINWTAINYTQTLEWTPKFIPSTPNILSYNYFNISCTDYYGQKTSSSLQTYTVKNYTAPITNNSYLISNTQILSEGPSLQAWCNSESTNSTASVYYRYVWYHNGIGVTAGLSSSDVQGINRLVNTQSITQTGNYTLQCQAIDSLTELSGNEINSSSMSITYGPAVFTNPRTNETVIYPKYGDDINLTVNVQDNDLTAYCYLYTNDTGSWTNDGLYLFDGIAGQPYPNNNQDISFIHMVEVNPALLGYGYWYAICFDKYENQTTSATYEYSVKNPPVPVTNYSLLTRNSTNLYWNATLNFTCNSESLNTTAYIRYNATVLRNQTHYHTSISLYGVAGELVKGGIILEPNGAGNYTLNCTAIDTVSGYIGNSVLSNTLMFDDPSNAPFIGTGANNDVNANNKSVFSIDGNGGRILVNITYHDINLFQANASIVCDLNGTIASSEILDINDTDYSSAFNIPLNQSLPLQKCYVRAYATDDHTANRINDYDYEKQSNKVIFDTPEGSEITIDGVSQTIINDNGNGHNGNGNANRNNDEVNSIDMIKKKDRYSMTFAFKNTNNKRYFSVKSDKPIYYREGSEYPAHFVVWNPETHNGNWIDFKEKTLRNSDYEVECISDYECIVGITTNKKVLEFESIGGSNMQETTFEFYIGGQLNLSTRNLVSNNTIPNVVAKYVCLDDGCPNNTVNTYSFDNSGVIYNLTQGTWKINFTDTNNQFIPIEYNPIIISGEFNASQNWTTAQAILNIRVSNIATGNSIFNNNITIENISVGYNRTQFINDSATELTTFYLNKGDYRVIANNVNYLTTTVNISLAYKQNRTLTVAMPFIANFFLLDEKTLEGFNVSAADRIDFTINCVDDTTPSTLITANVTAIPIACNYTNFYFSMYFGATNYIRSYILSPEEANSYNIYLINLMTTAGVQSEFIADDILSQYSGIKIYIKKNVGNNTGAQIYASPVDIENKVSTYLVQGQNYIIEIHSDNNPIFDAGAYQATTAGQRRVKLYSFDNVLRGDYFGKNVFYYIGVYNDSNASLNATYAYLFYNDTQNNTLNVNFKVSYRNGTTIYENNIPGPAFLAQVNISSEMTLSSILVSVNATLYNESGYSETKNYFLTKVVSYNEQIIMPFVKHLGPSFLKWFFLILFSVLAIYATMSGSVTAAVGIAVVLSFVALVGWFAIPLWTVGIIDLLVFAMFIKTRGNKKNE